MENPMGSLLGVPSATGNSFCGPAQNLITPQHGCPQTMLVLLPVVQRWDGNLAGVQGFPESHFEGM